MRKKINWNPFKKRYLFLENAMRLLKICEVKFKDGSTFMVF